MFSDLIQQIMLMQVQEAMPTIKRFTVLLYHCTSNRLNTNECSRELFCQGRSINNIPQTSVALWKHILQSCYIVRHVWAQSMIKVQTLPTQKDWGWKFKNKKLRPHWTDSPEAAVAIRDLIKCDCNWKKVFVFFSTKTSYTKTKIGHNTTWNRAPTKTYFRWGKINNKIKLLSIKIKKNKKKKKRL